MKISLFFSILVFVSCTSKPATQEVTNESASSAVETDISIPAGLKLITESDCQTCHHTSNNLIGPSYQAIANKYELNEQSINTLAAKIINGGSGVWGETPMNAHPNVSENDAKEMTRYILSLKEQ